MPPLKQPIIARTEVPPSSSDRLPANDPSIAQEASLLLVPICFIAIWAGVVCIIADTWKLNRKEVKSTRSLAQLPCKKCQYFSNNPYMKCAVNPHVAMTPSANECTDFRSRNPKTTHSTNR
ncbi:hypothetical protein ACQ4M3_32485 [Leptolyngbya sp. AN03gr2]|uniref:hypothetical protein n=1 Tax=unclassified Leptolyngbya TaxID=2650499 RepID=UPI003D310D4E